MVKHYLPTLAALPADRNIRSDERHDEVCIDSRGVEEGSSSSFEDMLQYDPPAYFRGSVHMVGSVYLAVVSAMS